MSGWRHPNEGQIDRATPIPFTFDGAPVQGFAGDTLASALLASGQRVLGRSFKYHRPRGLWGLGHEEPNALFDVTQNGVTTPNLRATTTRLAPGMALRSVNTAPSAARDKAWPLDLLHRFLPAGFYYKTFLAPNWMRYEPMIRRMAGLGRLDPGNTPMADIPHQTASVDLLVIGSGPAGLAAARAAADVGRSVWLIEDASEIGGSLRWRGGQIGDAPWQSFAAETRDRIIASGGRVLCDTLVWGAFDHSMFGAWQRRETGPDCGWHLRARDVVLASGALERPLWFANNDLPGILSAEAALYHLRLFGAVAGKRVILATANDGSYPVAQALAEAGCLVTLVDARTGGGPAPKDVACLRGSQVTRAKGTRSIGAVDIDGTHVDCDTLLVSGGYSPNVHLHCQAGGKLDWNAQCDALVPRPGTSDLRVVGAVTGQFGLAAALAEGHAAGGGTGPAPGAVGSVWHIHPMRPDPLARGRIWIDPQNDVTLKDVKLAAQEGYRSVEHLKRYTTLGMATDQGRNANFAGLASMAALTGQTITQTGTTTYRPPVAPVPLRVIAGLRRGALFDPPKRLALEPQHRAAEAQFRDYGGWLRPSAYGNDAEADLAQSEARIARQRVGLFDASSLGKIEVMGPGAGQLIDFCSYMRMSTLRPGRARYGFVLGETGVVHDDGVVLRLAQDHFIVSASSSHVASVRLILEEARQDLFEPTQSYIHDVTAQWVTLTVTGPQSRQMLQLAGVPDAVQDDDTLPHMGVMQTTWQDAPLRVARISFTGDRSYELSVPARHGPDLHARLEAARRTLDGTWIGLEALMILRAEKGFVLVGKDTDGVTLPHDLGWEGPRTKREDEYFGRRSLFTPEALRPDRRQLVGLEVADDTVLPTGAHLIPKDGTRQSLGFVTSSYHSPNLGRPIALAMVEAGRTRMGQELRAFHLGKTRPVTVVPACAFDPDGARLHD